MRTYKTAPELNRALEDIAHEFHLPLRRVRTTFIGAGYINPDLPSWIESGSTVLPLLGQPPD